MDRRMDGQTDRQTDATKHIISLASRSIKMIAPLRKKSFSEATAMQAYQERRRFVLDDPEVGGQSCPELRETRPCFNLPKCVAYRWDASPWSRCIFPHSYEKCGNGFRARGRELRLYCLINLRCEDQRSCKEIDYSHHKGYFNGDSSSQSSKWNN